MAECATCSKEYASALCGRCKYAYYCDVKCQRKDWKKHKKECKIWAKSLKQKKENNKTKQLLTHKRLCLILEGYFRECFTNDSLQTNVESLVISYLYHSFRKSGDCKALMTEILTLFGCVIGDDLLDFDISDYGAVFEKAAIHIMEGITLKAFKSKYFDPFYDKEITYYKRSTFINDKRKIKELNELKIFMDDAVYGDVLICTSSKNNHGYNDLDFVVGLNSCSELTFYRYSVDNGIGYISDSTEIVKEMKYTSPKGYYLNYYKTLYALYPSFTDYLKNRTGEWLEIALIDETLQKYYNLSNAVTLMILKKVGFPPDDYETKLFFNPMDAERDRMAKEMFATMQ